MGDTIGTLGTTAPVGTEAAAFVAPLGLDIVDTVHLFVVVSSVPDFGRQPE